MGIRAGKPKPQTAMVRVNLCITAAQSTFIGEEVARSGGALFASEVIRGLIDKAMAAAAKKKTK